MTDTKQKPDGYVAWSQEDGFFAYKEHSAAEVFKTKRAARWIKCPHKGKCCFNGGVGDWKVRPVKLVFLDEGEK